MEHRGQRGARGGREEHGGQGGARGQGVELLQTVHLVLTLFSFQGHPGPKGDMVRAQLSCLPKMGGGWPSLTGTAKHCKVGPAGTTGVAAHAGHSPAV